MYCRGSIQEVVCCRLPEAAPSDAGTETPQEVIAAEEDSADLVVMNGTITEAVLVVFRVADGSLLGSGFSASYSGLDQGSALLSSRYAS